MAVQSILFKRKSWTVTAAKQWLRTHNFASKDVEITPNELRFQQYDEKKTERYFPKKVGEDIVFIFGYVKKPKKSKRAAM